MSPFMFIGIDHMPHSMALREQHRAEHRRYMFDNNRDLVWVSIMEDEAGNQCGTTYVFDVEGEQDVWRWLKEEPFWKAGVYSSCKVVRCNIALSRHPITEWIVPAAN
jgi:hypothetical protein